MSSDFWTRTNELIKLKGLKQETICTECDINYQTFRGWIVRGTYPDALQTVKIAQLLNTTVEYLVTGQYSAIQYTDVYKQKYDKLVSDIKALIP